MPNNIINLFTNRTNQIILPNGLSAKYDILQGIDQGEVFLLYYGIYIMIPYSVKLITYYIYTYFITSSTRIKNINNPANLITHEFQASLVGYLDDTSWFSTDREQI